MTQTFGEETRDRGVALAIQAAGGVGPLARKLGISQPSVSAWSRVPAERVAAVEAVTGVSRAELRPDLFLDTRSAMPADMQAATCDPLLLARSQEYRMLAALLARAPRQAILDELSAIKGDATALGIAHIRLASAAQGCSEAIASADYFKLFVGIGRGELLPYASFYMTGFLHERPLACVREDLARLGVERVEGVFEPEDHIATVCEVMSGLIAGRIPGGDEQADKFFVRNVRPWAARFFADLAITDSAFYRAVGETGRVFVELETEALEMSP